jgi:hypothetical protein
MYLVSLEIPWAYLIRGADLMRICEAQIGVSQSCLLTLNVFASRSGPSISSSLQRKGCSFYKSASEYVTLRLNTESLFRPECHPKAYPCRENLFRPTI